MYYYYHYWSFTFLHNWLNDDEDSFQLQLIPDLLQITLLKFRKNSATNCNLEIIIEKITASVPLCKCRSYRPILHNLPTTAIGKQKMKISDRNCLLPEGCFQHVPSVLIHASPNVMSCNFNYYLFIICARLDAWIYIFLISLYL